MKHLGFMHIGQTAQTRVERNQPVVGSNAGPLAVGLSQANMPVQETAASVVERLRPLLLSPLATLEERSEVAAQVERLSHPAKNEWIMARVGALLDPYFEKETPQMMREMIAEDWLAELAGSPRWAIEAAVRWWKGAENKDRRRRPLEGDIKARVLIETEAVRVGRLRIAAFDAGQVAPKAPEPERKTLSAEERAALAASIGLPDTTPKRFPQQGAAT